MQNEKVQKKEAPKGFFFAQTKAVQAYIIMGDYVVGKLVSDVKPLPSITNLALIRLPSSS